jgi:D-beta-D-heptose 7-phosphate kinase / D-beta-D-heptose 1-phosphate adenosyltransferase
VSPPPRGAAALAGHRVVVLGDPVLDRWVDGEVSRLSREGPVAVLDLGNATEQPGGSGNAAANVASLGGSCSLVGLLGDDAAGVALVRLLESYGVSLDGLLLVPGGRTAVKTRVLVGGQLVARLDQADDDARSGDVRYALGRVLAERTRDAHAVLVSDYGHAADEGVVESLRPALAGRPLVVDGHDPTRWARLHPYVSTPNAQEAAAILGGPPPVDRIRFFGDRAGTLLDRCGSTYVVVTLDSEGALLLSRSGAPYHAHAGVAAPPSHTTGAGDTFAAALTLAVAAGLDLREAVELAVAASQVVVRSPATTVCQREDLEPGSLPLLDPGRLPGIVARHRAAGRRIVFTNGCFDVLHRGHVAYLQAARALGDVLVVGLNSDRSVRRLKGPGRPINTTEDRAAVLDALGCVDHVVAFDEDSPRALIRTVRPEVYVKGGDYTPELLPEAPLVTELGGQVRILGYLPGRSTTGLVARIRDPAPYA